MTVIGGLGTFWGPVVGSFLVEILSEYLRFSYGEFHLIILGLCVIFIVMYSREGLVTVLFNQAKRFVARFRHARPAVAYAV